MQNNKTLEMITQEENLDDLGQDDVFFRYDTKGIIHERNNG